jgi:hypothetical protein
MPDAEANQGDRSVKYEMSLMHIRGANKKKVFCKINS